MTSFKKPCDPCSTLTPLLPTDLSRMVGNRPCQLLPPLLAALTWLLLLTAALCCWSCWMEELEELLLLLEWEGSGFLVGKSSAAILFLSGPQVGVSSGQAEVTAHPGNRDCGEDPTTRGALTATTTRPVSVRGSCHVKDKPVQVTLLNNLQRLGPNNKKKTTLKPPAHIRQ